MTRSPYLSTLGLILSKSQKLRKLLHLQSQHLTLAMNGFVIDIQIDSHAQIRKASQCSDTTPGRSYQPQFSGKAHRIDRLK